MVAGNRAKTSWLALFFAMLVVQPFHAFTYDQETWDDLTKKEAVFLRTLRTRPLEVPAKGKVTQSVVCYFDNKYHYGVYVPKDYDPRKPWPVVFINSPTGNGWQYAMMYQQYAEQLGWILVGATEAKSMSTTEAIDNNICMIKDVLARFNVHKEMCIAAGFDSGARLSGVLAFADKDFPWMMGAIQMGAAQGPLPPVGGKQIYLICGKLDPNLPEVKAWDDACRKAGCVVESVEWNAAHQMPSGPMFYRALEWHTNQFLKHSPDTSEVTQQKREEYVQNLIDIARRGDSGNKVAEIYARYRDAYEAGSSIPCGLKMTKAAMALERRMNELARYPDTKKEVDCYAELQALIERVEKKRQAKRQKAAAVEAKPAADAGPAAPPPPPAEAPPVKAIDTPLVDPPEDGQPPKPVTKPKPAPEPQKVDDDDELIPEGDDLLPAELERRKQEAKAAADAAKAQADAEAKAKEEAQKKAEAEAKVANVPPWEAALALTKKYPGTPSAMRAQMLAMEWQMEFQTLNIPKNQLVMYGNPLPAMDPIPGNRLQPAPAEPPQK